ncbi:hypothetical protein OIU84_018052 [Salix udensis]|uniref:ACB domain-containing protein n=1 Tax=Salix udensis TaxID=889485 RepID=A0AAD6L4H9_9ROSI|nr:hypothetical protein OIU84_018052 [Salix udensis]
MAMARSSSGPAYPERFYAAAAYAGFDGSHNSTSNVSSKFQNDTALLLYALYQQATVGTCNVPKPSSWKAVEQSKWKSWQGLGNMVSTEAMRLFVKILEEDDPSWYSRASNSISEISESAVDTQVNETFFFLNSTLNPNGRERTKGDNAHHGLECDNCSLKHRIKMLSQKLSVQLLSMINGTEPSITGQPPKARYEHGAAIVQDKMYVYGGNHNGRYLNDLHVLDLRSWAWSKVNFKVENESQEGQSPAKLTPCAGHSLIPWENKLLSVAGHTKDPSETIQVKVFHLQSCTWSTLKTYGKAPVSRGGQSVTLVGTSLVIFGGQDAKKSLLNDLHILDLETMTWDEIDAVGVPPSPRSDHTAAVHAERYVLIFGGGSHATCFNDLHVLDLQTGEIPTPRAGHAGVTVGENWFIVGGGDNKSGVSETAGVFPLASEGLSLVLSSYNGEDVLVSFGGYNGRYSNEVNVLKPSHKSTLQSKITETPVRDIVSAVHNVTNPTRDVDSELEVGQEGKIREIVMDNVDQESRKSRGEGTSLIATLKAEREELDLSLGKEKLQTLHLKQELADAETRNTDLYKELQSVRGQLAAEQSRCFKLEVDVAELRQKLQTMETLQKELELLQRQKAASEQALDANHRQGSGGVWGWLAGTPGGQKRDDA